jgi:hypothetical protein
MVRQLAGCAPQAGGRVGQGSETSFQRLTFLGTKEQYSPINGPTPGLGWLLAAEFMIKGTRYPSCCPAAISALWGIHLTGVMDLPRRAARKRSLQAWRMSALSWRLGRNIAPAALTPVKWIPQSALIAPDGIDRLAIRAECRESPVHGPGAPALGQTEDATQPTDDPSLAPGLVSSARHENLEQIGVADAT